MPRSGQILIGEGNTEMKLRIGRVWSIPIELHYSWFPVFALLTGTLATQQFAVGRPAGPADWLLGCATAALFFACLLAHELAHCAVARRIGIRVTGITFFIFGGMARLAAEPDWPSREFLMAGAGPAMSLALAAVAFGGAFALSVAGSQGLALAALYLAVANLALGIFNLLPAFPMDGGRMLRAALWALWRSLERATRVAARLSCVLGLLLIAAGAYLGFVLGAWNGLVLAFMGGFLIQAADLSYHQVRVRQALAGRRVGGLMVEAPAPVPADLPVAAALSRWEAFPGAGVVPVAEGGRLVGLLERERAAAVPRVEQPFVPVSRLMRSPRRADLVRPESRAWNALLKMVETGRRDLYVIRRGALLGILRLDELLAVGGEDGLDPA